MYRSLVPSKKTASMHLLDYEHHAIIVHYSGWTEVQLFLRTGTDRIQIQLHMNAQNYGPLARVFRENQYSARQTYKFSRTTKVSSKNSLKKFRS